MDINLLRAIIGESVINSDFPKDAKIQLLNFVQYEANEHQLKALFMDGKIQKISESSELEIDVKFERFISEDDLRKAAARYKERVKDFGHKVGDSKFGKKMKKIANDPNVKVAAAISAPIPVPGAIVVGALIGLAVSASTKAYNLNFSQAAKACSNLNGSEKAKCVAKFQIKALRSQIKVFNVNKVSCKKTNDPKSCRLIFDTNIEKLQQKIANINTQLD